MYQYKKEWEYKNKTWKLRRAFIRHWMFNIQLKIEETQSRVWWSFFLIYWRNPNPHETSSRFTKNPHFNFNFQTIFRKYCCRPTIYYIYHRYTWNSCASNQPFEMASISSSKKRKTKKSAPSSSSSSTSKNHGKVTSKNQCKKQISKYFNSCIVRVLFTTRLGSWKWRSLMVKYICIKAAAITECQPITKW